MQISKRLQKYSKALDCLGSLRCSGIAAEFKLETRLYLEILLRAYRN